MADLSPHIFTMIINANGLNTLLTNQSINPRISEFSKVKRKKINTRKSTLFLYVHNEHVETKIPNTIHFTIAPP